MTGSEAGAEGGEEPLLAVSGLNVVFGEGAEAVHAVSDVDLSVARGRILGVVGESGCGKSAMALSLSRLLPGAVARVRGSIRIDGVDMMGLGPEELRRARGRRVSMVFQDPLSALNPVMRIGEHLDEAILAHRPLGAAERERAALEALEQAGLADARAVARRYPHELSGGMRQRAMIALALVNDPALLVADEPTTALDVTVQAQIIRLLRDLAARGRMGVVFISHDLSVVADVADEVVVMYAGAVVERGPARQVISRPHHPYTQALLNSVPPVMERKARLRTIPGALDPSARAGGACRFRARCERARPECGVGEPPPRALGAGREARCLFPIP